ncbi:ubiquinone anaerobic biosynthesis accessory factor UbiT [Ferrimonas lipolytica]|uniref:SCP2 sterol-binding domain-containing protein n=1 Tax=Ferrimonas lipolytica TaxID=2724191 RepID=A0A6H1UGG4_9GAMM|nr:SCP2 sterol-binding domain-containing protein [Ferrimonas lipolytica]QIZ77413.1 SCP2 sterol-binding domain-containing protein [Ferrimonas lipolytica]
MFRPPLLLLTTTVLPLLQRHFEQPIHNGELDFLLGRRIELRVDGAPWPVALTLRGEQLELQWPEPQCDAIFGGSIKAMVMLAFGQADGDALFFQRKLTMEGNTALALEVKSVLARYPLPLNLLPYFLPPKPEPLSF